MNTRSGKPRTRIVLGAATSVAVTSVMVGGIGAGTAAAQQLTRTFGYTCISNVIGNQPITVEIDSDAPNSVVVGEPTKTLAVNARATVGAGFNQWMAWAGMNTLEGTVDATAHVAAPQDDFDVTVPFHITKTSAPASGPFTVPATASVATRTFNQPGKGTVTAGDITLHLLAKNATGTAAIAADVPCTLNPGQSNLVTSFDITKPGSVASAPAGPTTGSVAPATPRRTTGSVAAAVPKPTTVVGTAPTTGNATTPGNPSPRTSSTTTVTNLAPATPRTTNPSAVAKPSAAGQDTRELILLAVGVLLACAAFYLGTRRKNHRRTDDDTGGQRHIAPKHSLPIEGIKDEKLNVRSHSENLQTPAPQPRDRGGRTTPRRSTARRITAGRNHPTARHVPHQGVGARACNGTDLDTQLLDLLQSEDSDVVIDEKPSTDYTRQA